MPKYINPKAKTNIYIDAANMFYSQKTIDFKIDYKKLFNFFERSFALHSISYYTGYDPSNLEQLKFLAKLEELNYKVISKPIKRICSRNKKRIDKANVDVELAIDAVMDMGSYKNIILASGDSDFGYLFEILKRNKKNLIVLSARGHISRELRQLSDVYIPLERLKGIISRQKITPPEAGEVNVW